MKTTAKQVVPLQPMDVHSGAHIHTAAHGGRHAGADICDLKEAVAHGEPTMEQASGGTCSIIQGPCWSALFLKDCTP